MANLTLTNYIPADRRIPDVNQGMLYTIKFVRDVFGISLVHAKDVVELIRQQQIQEVQEREFKADVVDLIGRAAAIGINRENLQQLIAQSESRDARDA